MPETAVPAHSISVGASRTASVDLSGMLDADETLFSLDSVVEVGSSVLTLSDLQVNTVQLVVNNRTAAIGKVAMFRVVGGSSVVAQERYQVKLTVTTTNGDTFSVSCWFEGC